MFRNPADFVVRAGSTPRAVLWNAAGDRIRDGELYFIDGISGGTGLLRAGETVAANACFTCEEALLTEPWASVTFVTRIVASFDTWTLSTDAVASDVEIDYDEDSPIFYIDGKVTNNSESALDLIAVRIHAFVDGTLVGAAWSQTYDVGIGATADFHGYGLGENPPGDSSDNADFEITVLGVNYNN